MKTSFFLVLISFCLFFGCAQATEKSPPTESYLGKILDCSKGKQKLKFKVISEHGHESQISYIAEFECFSEAPFHLQVLFLDEDGFEILRRPLADCAPSNPNAKETAPTPYKLKGTFFIPSEFYPRIKSAELRIYEK